MHLIIRKGPGAGQRFGLEQNEVLIGRAIESDLPIVDREVSRRHARLIRTGSEYRIEDLDSTNGTFVNQERLDSPRTLKPGDRIGLGSSVELSFEEMAESADTALYSETSVSVLQQVPDARQPRVFLSYSRQDKPFVQKLHAGLVTGGLKAWVDWEGIPLSADWWAEIVMAIEGSDAFIFVISPDSLQSKVARQELDHAIETNKRLIPVLHREPEEGLEIPPVVSAANWVFVRDDSELRAQLPELMKTVNTDLVWVREHTRLLQRAIEWANEGRDGSFLLRGEDLSQAESWMIQGKEGQMQPTALHLEYIQASRRDETRRLRRNQSISVVVAAVLVVLIFLALNQTRQANVQRGLAEAASTQAVQSEQVARLSEIAAIANERNARAQQGTAQAASTLAVANAQEALAQEATADARRVEAEEARAEAEFQRNEAVSQARRAKAGQLAALAQQKALTNPSLAAILALESQYASPSNPEAESVISQLPYLYPPIKNFLFGHLTSIQSLDWRPGGMLATGTLGGKVLLWDLAGQEILQELAGHEDAVNAVAWSSAGRLASGSQDGVVIIWDLQSGEPRRELRGHEGAVTSLAWSADGLLASGSEDTGIIVWNVETGGVFTPLAGHNGAVRSLSWNSRGILASGGDDNSVILWNIATGQNRQFLGHTDDVYSVAFGPGDLLASGSRDSNILIWSESSGSVLQVLSGHTGPVMDLDWDANGRLVSASEDQRLIIWDWEEAQPATVLQAHTRTVTAAAWAENGQLVSASTDGSLILWDTRILPKVMSGHRDLVSAVAWSPDGSILASSSDDTTVILWDQAGGTPLASLRRHRDWVHTLAWSPSGQLASGGFDGLVIIWDIANQQSGVILGEHQAPVLTVAWSADGRLASGDGAGRVIVWDLEFAVPASILEGHTGEVLALAWGPDGRLASAGEDGQVIVWEPDSGASEVWASGGAAFRSLAWSPDERLAAGDAGGQIGIWDPGGGSPVQTLLEHTGRVNSLAWSADGRLLSGGEDRLVISWDLENQAPARILAGHTEGVTTVAWHPLGTYIASAGGDNVVRILQARFLLSPCEWGVRNLFEQTEWSLYFPGEDYRATCELGN